MTERGRRVAYDRLRDPDWLRERYWTDQMTLAEIGDELGVSHGTVRTWMDEHGIERRERGGRVADERLRDPDWLRERYHADGQTLAQIGDELGVSNQTVRRRMDEHGIERRQPGAQL
jgi:DNA-binding transcriptional regulator LsrR (DeoR family)